MTAESFRPLAGRGVIVLDLDGVVYEGARALPGAVDAIARLRGSGRRVAFLTNNSGRTGAQIAEKLRGLGVACDEEDITTSGQAAADLIAERALDGGRGVHVFGSKELEGEVRARGLSVTSPNTCGVVLVGFDATLTYEDLARALSAALRGVPLVTCNRDASFPVGGGGRLPGCGAMTGALEGCAARSVDHVAGKPEPWILDLLLRRNSAGREDCFVVGDGLDSDVELAHRAGVPAVLVTAEGQPNTFDDSIAAFRTHSLADLANALLEEGPP